MYYMQFSDCSLVYLLLFVDNMLIAAKSLLEIKKILGMKFYRDGKARKLCLSQGKYIEKSTWTLLHAEF
jgi:hypothetical protein